MAHCAGLQPAAGENGMGLAGGPGADWRQTPQNERDKAGDGDDKRRTCEGDCKPVEKGVSGRGVHSGLRPGLEAACQRAPGGPVHGRPGECGAE